MRRLLQSFVLPALFVLCAHVALAQKVISGRVTDIQGNGIPSVTVSVKGTSTGTSTDTSGRFSLNVPTNASTLTFSSVGYQSQDIAIGDRTEFGVTLQTATGNLNEVVVVGYGTTRRRDLTGSVTAITSKDFQKGQITTPEQLIAGKVAGVQITSSGGAPGAGSTIRIRGGASLNATNDPLIVIDGVPLDNSNISGVSNPLSMINPNDIESFNILKDASAAAIYGSRASNGVIIITTKKGRAGQPRFNFNTQLSVATRANKVDVLNADEFRSYVNANGTGDQKNLLGGANTDWQDEIYQTGIGTDNNLSVSGGIGKVPFRASLGYLNQTGILRTDRLQRGTLGINVSPQLFDNHLKIDLNLKGSLSASHFAPQGAIGNAATFDPTQPVYSGSNRFGGFFEYLDPAAERGLRALSPINPVGQIMQRDDESDVQRSIGNVVFDYKFHFLPELRANLNLGYDISRGEGTIVVNDSAASGYRRYKNTRDNKLYGGENNQYRQDKENKLMEFYLNYAKDITSIRSRIDAIAGYGYQDFLTTNYNFPDLTYRDTVVSRPNFEFDEPQYTLISFYGRLNYTIMDRYLLTATVRRDGSSRFAEENRWGTFPSFAFAWRLKEEGFLKNSNLFSDLKLRLGYGETGQQSGIGLYDYISYYNLSNSLAQYQIGNEFFSMYRPGGYYAGRKWEQTATSNIGIDYGFLNGRISGSVEYYFKKTTDLLNEVPQPAGTNFSNRIVANIGEMENRGVEFNISADPIRSQDLTWTVNFNTTYNKNEITKLTISDDPAYLGSRFQGIGGTGRNIKVHSVGYPAGSFFVYQQVYDKTTGLPIEGLFEDRNRDGVINDKDLYRYKRGEPDVFMGFSTNVNYKKWNGGLVMRANFGNYIYNQLNAGIGHRSNVFATGYLRNAYADILTSGLTGTRGEYYFSDYYLSNGSFLRMDNLNIGYNLGKVFTGGNLRLNFNVQNVFTITKYEGLDPEIANGVDNNFYPRPRTFVFGANLDF
jgi:TonB-dependent starch-binding outer membrane protein SusC